MFVESIPGVGGLLKLLEAVVSEEVVENATFGIGSARVGHYHVFVKRQVVEVTEEEGIRAVGELSHSSGLKLPSRVIVGVEIRANVAKVVVGVSVGEVDSLDIASNNSSSGDLVVAHDLGGDKGNDTPSDIVGGGGIQPPPREERAELLVEVGWATGVHEVDYIVERERKEMAWTFLRKEPVRPPASVAQRELMLKKQKLESRLQLPPELRGGGWRRRGAIIERRVE